MKYLSDKSREKGYRYRYVFYVASVVLISFFWVTVKLFSFPILEPVVVSYNEVKLTLAKIPQFFSTYTTTRETLVAKNKTLEVTIENLENEIAERDAKLKELGVTESELGSVSGAVVVMYPLVRDISKIYSTILLSKGFKDGVEKDAYVYVRGLQPVCVIKEVYTSTSLCELLSSSGIVTEAVIEGEGSSTPIIVTLVGRGGGTFLGDVPRDTPINHGDKVMLKSDHSMVIGNVVDVLHNNQDTSWHVFVRGAYNPVSSSIFYLRKSNI